MARIIVSTLIEQLGDAFERDREHSLLGNLREIDDAGWRWKPEGGQRTVAGVVWHAGSAKYLYHSHAFGDRSVTWEHPLTAPSQARTIEEAIPWLREGQRLFIEALSSLSDDDLAVMKPTHWGAAKTVRFAIETIIRHDVFHAGEINHLRALMQGNDRWGYFGPPAPPSDS
jgi:uncharacterized damage-inducible protein DinB